MITFQSIIDEARKRKEKIAKNFYQTLQLGEECPLEAKYFWLWNLGYQICSKAVEKQSSTNSRRF